MTSRERKLLMFVSVFGLVVIALGAWQLIWKPLQQAKQDQANLLDEVSEKQAKVDKATKDLLRLKTAKKRSLPAEVDVAKREYEAMLGQLLAAAGVTGGTPITAKDTGDPRTILELAPKKPSYTRIGYDIKLTKIDLPTLTKFLLSYYQLNLLHKITHLEIKKTDREATARKSGERADLEVSLHTEAIILDGAEPRRGLLSAPAGVFALLGGAGATAAQNTSTTARSYAPQQFVPLLAYNPKDPTDKRDYQMLAAKDPFHGPLPKPEEPKVAKVTPPPPPPPAVPKEDISPYIKMNGLTISGTGLTEATLWDVANNHTYEITLKLIDGKTTVKVEKFFTLDGKRKRLDKWTELVISEEDTATDRKFQVLGTFEDGLVLTEKLVKLPTDSKTGVNAPFAAVAGATAGVALPNEKTYHWRVGQPLSAIQELSESESKRLLLRPSRSEELVGSR